MSFASVDRSNSTNTTSNEINQNNSIRDIEIHPKVLHSNKRFSEEIPKEFKYNNWIGKLKFWNRASRDRWAWDKIPEDAKDLDSKFDCRNPQSIVTPAADKASEKLKSDSIDYLNKNRSRMKENDTYTDSDKEDDVIISKRTLLAAKMINKIVRSVENGGSLIALDDNGEEIKEGAKNVTLLPSATLKYFVQGLEIPEEKYRNSARKFKDCRKEKLFEHEPKAEDCRQLSIGDCWLQSTLIDILNKKGSKPIKEMLKDDGASGNVKVRLYKPSSKFSNGTRNYYLDYVPRIYTVPKQIPVSSSNEYIYNNGAKWVYYIQAAVAKSGIRDKFIGENCTKKDEAGNKSRDYSSIIGGNPMLGWPMILGNDIKIRKILIKFEDDNISRYLDSSSINNDIYNNKFKNYSITEFVNRFKRFINMNLLGNNGTRDLLKDGDAINESIDSDDSAVESFVRENINDIVPGNEVEIEEFNNGIFNTKIKEAYIYALIKQAVDNKKLIYINFTGLGKSDRTGISGGEEMSKGLAEGHAYSICGYEEIGGTRYINVINPWNSRIGRDEESGKEKSFKGIGNESFRLKISTFVRYMNDFYIED